MLWIFGIPVVLLVVGIWFARKNSDCMEWEIAGTIAAAIGGLWLLITLLMLPISHIEVRGKIQQFNAVEATLTTARERGDHIENAAFQIKVSEANEWLAEMKYYDALFDWYYPDEVLELDPIR